MKALTTMTAIAAVLAIWAPTSRAQPVGVGTPDFTVNIALTATVQGDITDDNGVTTYAKPTRVRLANRDILDRLMEDHGTNYPAGAKIILRGSDGTFAVEDRQGNVLDSIPELTLTYSDTQVISGKSDDTTLAGHQSVQVLVTLSFDDSGDSSGDPIVASASGILSGSSTISKPDKNATQRESVSGSARLAGEGTVGGTDAVVSGSLRASGRGPFTPPS